MTKFNFLIWVKIKNRMKISAFLVTLSIIASFKVSGQDELIYVSDQFEKIWETEDTFRKPESVCFDTNSEHFYVSNINGSPNVKDNDGFISKLSKTGEIIQLQWIKGLHAPKGMAIHNNLLYVTDIDHLVVIDIESSKIKDRIFIPKSSFLNDLVIDNEGHIYMTDTFSRKLFKYQNNKVDILLDEELNYPNGLAIQEGQLIIGNTGYIIKYNIKKHTFEKYCTTSTGIEGLKCLNKDEIIYTDRYGNTFHIDADKRIKKIIGTSRVGINAADFEYIPHLNLILIPTYAYNTVSAYKIKS
jgi:hypothetical protein